MRQSQRSARHNSVIPHLFDPHLKGMLDSCHMFRRAISAVCSQLALLYTHTHIGSSYNNMMSVTVRHEEC